MATGNIVAALRQARATYAAAVQQALGAADPDELVAAVLGGGQAAAHTVRTLVNARPKAAKRKHWTQTPAGRKKMAAIAHQQQAAKKPAKAARKVKEKPASVRAQNSALRAFVVETLRVRQPLAKVELTRLMSSNGYNPRALGALSRHGYVYHAHEGYILGPKGKQVSA